MTDRPGSANPALEARIEALRPDLEGTDLPVSILDPQTRFRFVNAAYCAFYGRSADALVGRTPDEAFTRSPADRRRTMLERAFAGETTVFDRETLEGPNAGRWVRAHYLPLHGEGAIVGVLAISTDIQHLKDTERALAERERHLTLITDVAGFPISYVDKDMIVRFVNRPACDWVGLSPAQILGRPVDELTGPEASRAMRPLVERALAGEKVTYEREARWPGGETRRIRGNLLPDRDQDGEVRGILSIAFDIEEDHRLKEELLRRTRQLEDKERQLRQVIDAIPTPMVYCDADSRYQYVNAAFLDYVGLSAGEVIGRTIRELIGDERWEQHQPELSRVRAGESTFTERLLKYADGRERWTIVRLTPRFDSEGKFLGHYAMATDIHEQKMVEQELRRANAVLSAHLDNTPLAVIEWDTAQRVVRWSGQAEAIFGWSAAEMLGRANTDWRFVYEEDEEAAAAMLRRLLSGPGHQATLLSRNYRKDGSVIWVEWHHSALRDESQRVISILSLAQDVSSRIQAEERLQYMATHDGLTGLPNRILLNDRLEGALARARRAQRGAAVMFLDLDHFKDVNDTLGHRIGDELLKELARRLRAALRQTDLLARISGDEFVMVLEDLPPDEVLERVAAKVLEEARRPFRLDGHEIHVSASLGLALYPEDGDDAELLLKNADAAMYHAKELGRNSFRTFSAELAARRSRRHELESALRRALKSEELTLHFQPILDLASGAVRRAEALLRWQDPQRGLVLPMAFIALAEESGLGHEIGHWVMHAACRQARAWRDSGLGDIVVCVNLSPGQLRDANMVSGLESVLEKTGCEARWLECEITETSMVRDLEGVSLTLARLRALGVRIAIDDFGTGFSSLSHLRHLPADALKIDRTFVADIDASGKARRPSGGAAIVSAVIGLARGLGLEVVAEGIERKSQHAFLVRQGCAFGQGYLFCPPLPAPEFEQWLKARRKRKKKTTR